MLIELTSRKRIIHLQCCQGVGHRYIIDAQNAWGINDFLQMIKKKLFQGLLYQVRCKDHWSVLNEYCKGECSNSLFSTRSWQDDFQSVGTSFLRLGLWVFVVFIESTCSWSPQNHLTAALLWQSLSSFPFTWSPSYRGTANAEWVDLANWSSLYFPLFYNVLQYKYIQKYKTLHYTSLQLLCVVLLTLAIVTNSFTKNINYAWMCGYIDRHSDCIL